ncbi:MAG: ATP-binding protein [Leptospirales bacterium]
MTLQKTQEYLLSIVHELCKLPNETEWVEFKYNKAVPEDIGEYISALSNSASLLGKVNAYLVWGINDTDHSIIGTDFQPSKAKKGSEELENWLLKLLNPKINFSFFEINIAEKNIVLLEISATIRTPVQFKNQEYIRIGSYKKKLKEYPEKERELWRIFDKTPYESLVAVDNISSDEVLKNLNYPAYFDLLNIPLPSNKDGILEALLAEKMITKSESGLWNIMSLGAILFAKKLSDFDILKRKAVRVVVYRGKGRIETIREREGAKGYASGFEGLIDFIKTLLPLNEVIEKALRKSVPMYPELAIREVVANAIIHQDFEVTGSGILVEIFDDRMEITNPGTPLVETERFLDSPPQSRNEALASFMRRIGVCEERGSGIDKIVFESEHYQLPAPLFEVTNNHTRTTLFAHKEYKHMDKQDRIRATYLHSCLRYVEKDYMTNSTLRERFGIEERNSAMVSRVIKETTQAEQIKPFDPTTSKKYMKYIPWWV